MYAQGMHSSAATSDYTGYALCRGLDRRASSQVVTMASTQRLQAGQQLFGEGDRADGIYEVASGIVRLYKLLPDGRRQIIGFLSDGHLLGLAHRENYVHTAEAVTPVTLHRYSRAGFDRLLDEVPSLARRLLSATSDELRAAQDQMLLLGRKSACEKIASFLLTIASLQGEDGDADEVQVPMARCDIADYLGLTVETVSRTLAKLKQDEIIELPTPNRVALVDRDRLEDLAAGECA